MVPESSGPNANTISVPSREVLADRGNWVNESPAIPKLLNFRNFLLPKFESILVLISGIFMNVLF